MPLDLALAACATAAPAGALRRLTPAMLRAAFPRCPDPQAWAGPLVAACVRYRIDSVPRLSSFLGEAGHESGGLRSLRECLDYTPARLLEVFPYRCKPAQAAALGRTADRPADQAGIAELVYGGRRDLGNDRKGDGALFCGRGAFQITGRFNYSALASALGRGVEEVSGWLETPEGAAWGAAWFWDSRRLNDLADRHDFDEISRRINGAATVEGVNGLADRRARRALVAALLSP